MSNKKVVVAMSGGVDSSVAAALLLDRGYDVTGLTFDLFPSSDSGTLAIQAAVQVARALNIDHHIVDLKKEFENCVIEDFCSEYIAGRTPNPCIRCNPNIKFEALRKKADLLGAECFATGHYAQVERNQKTGRFDLKKGLDASKDQSYFLYGLSQEQLSRCMFPVGEFTKESIKQKARERSLPAAERAESQEICFIPDNDYVNFLKIRAPRSFAPGPIIDSSGKIIGRHNGIANFTIGQRRGMGIAAPSPLYVVRISAADNTIVAGPDSELFQQKLTAERVNLISMPISTEPFRADVKIRYKHNPASARVVPLGSDRVEVVFDQPQKAITPGQAVVFYNDDIVIGGGLIL